MSADALVPTRYRVAARHRETASVVTLDLEPVDPPIAEPRPGQFTMLYAFGAGEVPISVSGLPADDGVLRHSVAAVGAATRALCRAHPGEVLGVRGPYGRGWDLDSARGGDVVVLGGGIGLAPLRAAVRQLLAEPPDGRLFLLVGARSPADLPFASELQAWRRLPDIEVELTVDAAEPGWDGDVGLITQLLPGAGFDPARTTALVCGPEVMLRVAARALLDRGVPAARIQVSLERNMQCGVGRCGHCQLGPRFVCCDGPVFDWAGVEALLAVRGR